MEFFDNSQNDNKRSSKKRLREDQVWVLERSFNLSKELEPDRKIQLADQLGVSARQVAIWYQNKRARWRTQSLELDRAAMQARLEAARAETGRLEREVSRLRRELGEAKAKLSALDDNKSSVVSSVSSSFSNVNFYNNNNNNNIHYDNGNNNYNNSDTDGHVLQFDHDLFACLIDGSDSERGLFSE